MGFSENSCSSTNLNRRNHFSVRENRPRMLKDFLIDDSNSCSSSRFASFPRKPLDSKLRALIENDPESAKSGNSDDAKNPHRRNPKPDSFSHRISALQAVINAVKSISFTSVKPRSILPRSFSQKLSKTRNNDSTFTRGSGKENKEITQVKVKDIIRWPSFGDLEIEEESPPSECWSTSTSNASSWCDSDFSTTSEYLPPWINGDDEVKNFSPFVGENLMDATTTKTTYAHVVPKQGEEKQQQHSPVSVIDFCKLEEDDEGDSRSLLDQSFADVERTKHELVEKIRGFDSLAGLDPINLENWMSMEEPTSSSEEEEGEETNDDDFEEEDDDEDEIEEKAWELLNHIRGGTPHPGSCISKLLLDFFREELARQNDKIRDDQVGHEISNRAKAWLNGEHGLWMGWEVKDKRKNYVKEMERGVNWITWDQEAQEEIAVAIGNETLGLLVDELLLDLLGALQWIDS